MFLAVVDKFLSSQPIERGICCVQCAVKYNQNQKLSAKVLVERCQLPGESWKRVNCIHCCQQRVLKRKMKGYCDIKSFDCILMYVVFIACNSRALAGKLQRLLTSLCWHRISIFLVTNGGNIVTCEKVFNLKKRVKTFPLVVQAQHPKILFNLFDSLK